MKKLTPYQKEYNKYINTYIKHPSIMPCFMDYLIDQRDEAGRLKHWAKYQYFSNLITEEVEETSNFYTEEAAPTWDSDGGL